MKTLFRVQDAAMILEQEGWKTCGNSCSAGYATDVEMSMSFARNLRQPPIAL
jgi:hypothetical protein